MSAAEEFVYLLQKKKKIEKCSEFVIFVIFQIFRNVRNKNTEHFRPEYIHCIYVNVQLNGMSWFESC